MIAVSWAVSTVISIPPLFGLKDPVIGDNYLQNLSSGALPDVVGGSFNQLVIGKGDWNRVVGNEQTDSTESGWANETVSRDDINCVISVIG